MLCMLLTVKEMDVLAGRLPRMRDATLPPAAHLRLRGPWVLKQVPSKLEVRGRNYIGITEANNGKEGCPGAGAKQQKQELYRK